jgi:hypothetical protein
MNKKLASQQYSMNQMGMGPKPRKGNKKSSETVTCTSEKPGSCGMERGEVRRGGSVKEAKTSSATKGVKNVVMQKGSRKEARWQRKISKVRESAKPKQLKSKF